MDVAGGCRRGERTLPSSCARPAHHHGEDAMVPVRSLTKQRRRRGTGLQSHARPLRPSSSTASPDGAGARRPVGTGRLADDAATSGAAGGLGAGAELERQADAVALRMRSGRAGIVAPAAALEREPDELALRERERRAGGGLGLIHDEPRARNGNLAQESASAPPGLIRRAARLGLPRSREATASWSPDRPALSRPRRRRRPPRPS